MSGARPEPAFAEAAGGGEPARWRAAVPNAVTAAAVLVALTALAWAHEGAVVAAGWLLCWVGLLDRIDGGLARALRGTSPFGAQLDALADAIGSGVAPAAWLYLVGRSLPALGCDQGWGFIALVGVCGGFVLASLTRLARFMATGAAPDRFRGVPTTLAAGIVVTAGLSALASGAAGPALASHVSSVALPWPFVVPWAAVLGLAGCLSVAMLAPLRLPKLGFERGTSAAARVLVLVGAFAGAACVVLQVLPALACAVLTAYVVAFARVAGPREVPPAVRG